MSDNDNIYWNPIDYLWGKVDNFYNRLVWKCKRIIGL